MKEEPCLFLFKDCRPAFRFDYRGAAIHQGRLRVGGFRAPPNGIFAASLLCVGILLQLPRNVDASFADNSNFQQIYRPLADSWAVYDNSGVPARLLEKGR